MRDFEANLLFNLGGHAMNLPEIKIIDNSTHLKTAEGVGFEPTRACALPVFKTGAINHSTTPPGAREVGVIDLNRPRAVR